ncbi:MAG: ROK family protein [Anaerolineaceae bacterium]
MSWYAGVEAGGTKFNCIVASDPKNILAEIRIPTTTPEETLPKVINFFNKIIHEQQIQLTSIGLGFFGPLCLDIHQSDYGFITSTPKIAWRNTSIVSYFEKMLKIPVAFDTDVTAAALGEGIWGNAQDCLDYIYMTIGTGIGGGIISSGKPLHGMIHPEIGHMFIPHNRTNDPFEGICPSHKDCLEGLASGPAIKARWGKPAELLPFDHQAWEIESEYLAYAIANLALSFSPQRFILGGGVMKISGLLNSVHSKTVKFLNGYIQSEIINSHSDTFIQLPGLGDKAGVLGSIALAKSIDLSQP